MRLGKCKAGREKQVFASPKGLYNPGSKLQASKPCATFAEKPQTRTADEVEAQTARRGIISLVTQRTSGSENVPAEGLV